MSSIHRWPGIPAFIWRGGELRLAVEATPDELRERLRRGTSIVESAYGSPGRSLRVDTADGELITVRPALGTTFGPRLVGRIEPDGAGSVIAGKFELSAWLNGFLVLTLALTGFSLYVAVFAGGRFLDLGRFNALYTLIALYAYSLWTERRIVRVLTRIAAP